MADVNFLMYDTTCENDEITKCKNYICTNLTFDTIKKV